MAQDNEYVQKLIAARDREVAHRRDIAWVLAEKHNRGDMENMGEAFIKIQDVIEAMERAVWHERYIASQKARAVLAFRLRNRAVMGGRVAAEHHQANGTFNQYFTQEIGVAMSQNNPNQSGQQTQQPSQKPGQGGQQGGQQR